MKAKLLLAGLVASTALVGCTNDDILTAENGVASKGSIALIFDGFGTPDTRMAYDKGEFKWNLDGTADAIGVLRTMDGSNVISNSKFTAVKVTDDNTKPLDQWNTSGTGKYAYFETENESIFEGNYVMTYPWNKDLTKDGIITATLATTQSAGAAADANYVADYGFMMSTATAFEGGQTTGRFVLYPVFSRLKLNVKSSVTGANLQSVILRSKDGAKIFPTELEIPANITVANGYLDASKMTAKEESKVSQLVLTMENEALKSDAATDNLYLSVIPGKYSNVEIVFVTDKGSYTYQTANQDVTLSSGRYAEINATIDDLVPNREYYVATATDWKQAMTNIKNLSGGDGSSVTINVTGNVEMTGAEFASEANIGTPAIVVNGEGSITIKDNSRSYALKDITFNVPVATDDNIGFTAVDGDNLTFNKGLTVNGNFSIAGNPTYKIVGGSITGTTTFYSSAGVLTAENVAFKGLVTVTATAAKTDNGTSVNLKNCIYTAGLTLNNTYTTDAAITIDGATFDDGNAQTATSALTIAAPTSNAATVILKGDVTAEKVAINGGSDKKGTLDIYGNLSVIAGFTKTTTDGIVNINKDGSLTLGEDIEYTVADALLKVEGTLTNNGEMTFSTGVSLTDIDQSNNHKGTFINNGIISVPMDDASTWYASQNITVQKNENFYLTGVNSAENFAKAIATQGVTGVELTYAADFTDAKLNGVKDFSAYDIVLGSGAATITVPDGLKLGDLTVNETVALQAKEQAGAAITIGDLNVETSRKLTVTNTTNKVTVNCVNIVNEGEIENGGQITYTGSLTGAGSIKGAPVKK